MKTVSTQIGETQISIETGRIAKQAGGSAIVRMGDTMVLATVCGTKPRDEGSDFFPLTVEYVEKAYAAGKIPGGFFKREGKPSEKEILTARLIDRPARPLFPEGYNDEIQIVATVISADENYDPDVLAVTAASTALSLSSLPYQGPVGCVRMGMVDGNLKVFPTLAETEIGGLDLVVAGTADSIVMVEGGAWELPEEKLIEAILMAHEAIKKIVAIQNDLVNQIKPVKTPFVAPVADPAIHQAVNDLRSEERRVGKEC
jgi:polyribonucleotide nucleotidyltransferase